MRQVLDNLTILSLSCFLQYDRDYRSANRYHQDRLLGETIHSPDIWFEYGCFSMRVRMDDICILY